MRHAKTLVEFLEMRTSRLTNGCWAWTGKVDDDGYGRTVDKWYRLHNKSGAHQLSYIAHIGVIPANMLVCHSCDNPTCINPAHLFLGTPQDNMTDKVLKYRQITKLSDQQVISIRMQYQQTSITQANLSQVYGVSETAIKRIVDRTTWKHI